MDLKKLLSLKEEMYLKIKLSIIVLLHTLNFLVAQSTVDYIDSIEIPDAITLFTSYNKILNVHSFNSTIRLNQNFDKIEFKLTNRFNSNIVFTSIKNIRDENYLNSNLTYSFSKYLKPTIAIESKRINDNRKIGISRFKDLSIKGVISTNPYASINISPFYGYKMEEQFVKEETGNTFGLEGLFDEMFSNSKFAGNLRLQNDNLSIRKSNLLNSELLIENLFSDYLHSQTRFYFNRISRDYFIQIDSITAQLFSTDFNIENREDNIIDFTQRFELINIADFSLNIAGNFYSRLVDKDVRYKNLIEPTKNIFDTRVNEFRFNLQSESNLRIGKLLNSFKINYSERSEKHSVKRLQNIPDYLYYQRLDEELQKNNFSTRIIFGIQNKLNIYKKDTLSIEGSISKLKYDTPPLENYLNPLIIIRDDRDELLYIIRIQYLKFFTTRLQVNFLIESFNNHLVYLYKERSSNNNWNRVIRLATLTNYSSPRFSTKNQFEVLANYTVYDFEDLFQGSQSFAFRQFIFNDSTKFNLSPKFFVDIVFNLRLSEQGTLNWRRFSSFPGRFLNEQFGEFKIGNSLSSKSFISSGIRYTSLTEFNFKGKEKNVVLELKSIGPLIEMFLFIRNDFYMNLKGWIEYISQTNMSKRRNINFSFNSYLLF